MIKKEKILQEVLKNREVAEKNQQAIFKNTKKVDDIFEVMEEVVTIVRKLDQERVATTDWLKRDEDRIMKIEQKLAVI